MMKKKHIAAIAIGVVTIAGAALATQQGYIPMGADKASLEVNQVPPTDAPVLEPQNVPPAN